ncbi:hypothetical protein T458_28040 [Brevibacillus panacihumi W25]|uniref:Uncharacterized protein n=1 Tax=Brevibacillus panacihumi W25 TaxID=1408254 RepID=V6M0U9_9BACL|nr:hypothetical protein [Brevibacillus panacihumi]EST52244.1 hypothetical protein T458_28040 [Brevibacillus panacihumi W25]
MNTNNKFLIVLLTLLVFSNGFIFIKMNGIENRFEKLQREIDSNFKEGLRLLSRSLKKDTDWGTKFDLALSHASKIQVLSDNTSYTSENNEKSRIILSYSYMLQSYFQDSQNSSIDENKQELEELIRCLDELSSNPSNIEYGKKLISLLR